MDDALLTCALKLYRGLCRSYDSTPLEDRVLFREVFWSIFCEQLGPAKANALDWHIFNAERRQVSPSSLVPNLDWRRWQDVLQSRCPGQGGSGLEDGAPAAVASDDGHCGEGAAFRAYARAVRLCGEPRVLHSRAAAFQDAIAEGHEHAAAIRRSRGYPDEAVVHEEFARLARLRAARAHARVAWSPRPGLDRRPMREPA